MYFKVISSLLLSSGFLLASNNVNVKSNELKEIKDQKFAYVNINSNAPHTKIYFDDILIGEAPLHGYEVDANKLIKLKAVADTKLYPKAIEKLIKLQPYRTRTIDLHFKKGFAKLLLIGDDGYLYINDRFDRTLTSNNRVVKIEAGKNTRIDIKNHNKQFSIVKDFYTDKFYQYNYSLKKKKEHKNKNITAIKKTQPNKPVDTRTVIIDTLMWEQVEDSSKNIFKYDQANKYCNSLSLLDYNTWRLPTIDELKELDKTKFHFELSDKFYWSGTTTKGKYIYWTYALAKEFTNNSIKPKIKTYYKGSTMCVRDLDSTQR